ncbi:ABC transporter ATP-binding protein [Clostridium sp.]|uniref:ABC transporter ATP-binding protein n=1 Tax=Clostridium sp. TaxID=1506 RepID=UPI0035A0EA51
MLNLAFKDKTEKISINKTASIVIENVNKVYETKKSKVLAIEDVNIRVNKGDFVSIIGPSGCGKSTLLRMVAGLDTPTSGRITMNDKEVTGPGAERGMVFQSYTLFPWMTVRENIRFGLKIKKLSKDKSNKIVDKYLELIELTKFGDRLPKELSGGMKQRVAIARALANNPEVILMDEPFGALDPQTKVKMQELLLKIWRVEGSTVIFITHDIEESIFLSEKVYLMSPHPGKIQNKLEIDFPKNRTADIRDTEKFISIKRKVLSLFKDDGML